MREERQTVTVAETERQRDRDRETYPPIRRPAEVIEPPSTWAYMCLVQTQFQYDPTKDHGL